MTEAPPVQSRWSVGLRQALLGGVAMAVVLGLVVAIPLAPLVVDDWRLDGVVRAVALDVRDFGVEKGWERLRFELAAQGLERRLAEDQCTVDLKDGVTEVECRWQVTIDVPIVDRQVPLRFHSLGQVDVGGDLR